MHLKSIYFFLISIFFIQISSAQVGSFAPELEKVYSLAETNFERLENTSIMDFYNREYAFYRSRSDLKLNEWTDSYYFTTHSYYDLKEKLYPAELNRIIEEIKKGLPSTYVKTHSSFAEYSMEQKERYDVYEGDSREVYIFHDAEESSLELNEKPIVYLDVSHAGKGSYRIKIIVEGKGKRAEKIYIVYPKLKEGLDKDRSFYAVFGGDGSIQIISENGDKLDNFPPYLDKITSGPLTMNIEWTNYEFLDENKNPTGHNLYFWDYTQTGYSDRENMNIDKADFLIDIPETSAWNEKSFYGYYHERGTRLKPKGALLEKYRGRFYNEIKDELNQRIEFDIAFYEDNHVVLRQTEAGVQVMVFDEKLILVEDEDPNVTRYKLPEDADDNEYGVVEIILKKVEGNSTYNLDLKLVQSYGGIMPLRMKLD